jgi:hypothetical protein
MKLFPVGAWLVWLVGENRHGDMPSRRSMRWNTRHVNKTNMGQWYRQTNRRNMPLYEHQEAILWRLDVTPYVGKPYTLWEIDHDFHRGTRLHDHDFPDRDALRFLTRLDFFSSEDRAWKVFRAIAQGHGVYIRMSRTGEPPLRGDACFRIVEGSPEVLYVGDDVTEPMDIIDLIGRDVHDAITEWLAARTAAGLPRTGLEVEES